MSVLIERSAAIGLLAACALGLSGCDLSNTSGDADESLQTQRDSAEMEDLLLRSREGEMAEDEFVTERMLSAAEDYLDAIATARAEIAAADRQPVYTRFEDLRSAVARLDDWVAVIDAGASHRLTPEQDAAREALSEELSALQRVLLPRLRAQFVIPEGVLEAEAYCHAHGPNNSIVQCVARDFRDQPRMVRFHNRIRSAISRLRFTETRYQPERHVVNHFYRYFLEPPADGDVVVWTPVGDYRDPS